MLPATFPSDHPYFLPSISWASSFCFTLSVTTQPISFAVVFPQQLWKILLDCFHIVCSLLSFYCIVQPIIIWLNRVEFHIVLCCSTVPGRFTSWSVCWGLSIYVNSISICKLSSWLIVCMCVTCREHVPNLPQGKWKIWIDLKKKTAT